MSAQKIGRPNQKSRTRKDLLQAAAYLMKQGRRPTLEEVAEQALVSRATAYRYFASIDALLVEAPLDGAVPEPEDLFQNMSSADPVERLERVEGALHSMIVANEAPLRMMLAQSLQRTASVDSHGELPSRQNRRTVLIAAALQPVRHQFRPAALKSLMKSLALIIGTESMVVFKDVLQVDDIEAQKVRRWAIKALVDAARKPGRDASRA